MAILVSDANIFVDMDVAGLTHAMFGLNDTFATPDVLYHEELSDYHSEPLELGLQIEALDGDAIAQVEQMVSMYAQVSLNDLFALVLAKERGWPLLTGDRRLREVADEERVEIYGTLWLVERLVDQEIITFGKARAAFELMRNGGRRLPWKDVDVLLARLEQPESGFS